MASEQMRRRMAALVRQWDASGETREAFARRHGLTVSRLDYWKRQLRQASARDAAVGFAPVRVVGDLDTQASAGVEVVLAGGERVVVRDGASVDLLRTVLTALRASC
jgi:hypothetical protein